MKKIGFVIGLLIISLFLLSCFSSSDGLTNRWLRTKFKFQRVLNTSKLSDCSPLKKDGMILVFEENFEKKTWKEENAQWRVGGSALYHPRKLNVYYGPPELRNGGYAAFTVRYNPKELYVYQFDTIIEFPYEVSKLTSHSFFEQQYGRFECRMTLPVAKHSWPAFWMWGRPWPPEIDVIEAYGKETGLDAIYQEINLHWGEGDNPQQMGAWKIKIDKPENLGQNFYEFAVEWRPDRVDFFTNGVRVFQFTDTEVLNRWFDQSMWVVINNSIKRAGFSELGEYYYSEFLVDYIRVYQFEEYL